MWLAGATEVPEGGTSLMQFDFTVPGGFDPATQGFRVAVVPAHPSNPELFVTYAGEGYDLALGSAVVGTLGVANFELCDVNQDGSCDVDDIDALTAGIANSATTAAMDLNSDGSVDLVDRDVWVRDLMHLYYGDSNLDGEFNTSDLVFVLQQGQFEDAVVGNSTWGSGDWSGDLEFSTSDFITAFQDGGFEQGPLRRRVCGPRACQLDAVNYRVVNKRARGASFLSTSSVVRIVAVRSANESFSIGLRRDMRRLVRERRLCRVECLAHGRR